MNWKRVAKSVRDHAWGPVGSVFFHCAIVLVIVAWTAKPHERPDLTDVEIHPVAPPDPIKLDAPIITRQELAPRESLPDPVDFSAPPDFANEQADLATTTSEPMNEAVGFAGIDADMPHSVATMDLAQLHLDGPIGWRVAQKGDRNAGPKNTSSRPTTKSKDETDACVHRALVWLKEHQNEDGSWGPNQVAMTGLALLTFLGRGETSGSPEFGMTVRRAIDWLAEHQRADGFFATGKQLAQPTVYEHAIGTYAICEAYGMTRRPDLRPQMERAAAVIVSGQQAGGLWDYEYKKTARTDTSVSGWQIQALKAAFVNGAEVEGLAAAIAKSADGIRSTQSADSGRFSYAQSGAGKISMTGVGALCLELTGNGATSPAKLGLLALREADCNWQKPEQWPLYTWYYVTQALYHDHGEAWDSWSRNLLKEFVRNQNADGSWNSPTGDKYENEESKHGPVYSTTLAVLSLSAQSRYAPVSQSLHNEQQRKVRMPADEVRVDVI